jgi:predicted NBD/HSP70 family sugar kinase
MQNQLSANESWLLALLECDGQLTRTELADRCGLPRTTVTGAVARLVNRGLVTEQDGAAAGVGRPPQTLRAIGRPRLVAVVSASEAAQTASVLTYAGELLGRSSLPREPRPAASGTSGDLVELALGQAGLPASRLAMLVARVSAPVSRAESDPRTAEIDGRRVPALHENDANLGALGEAAFGAGRGLDSLIFVKLGHNVGAGLVIDGRLRRGATGFAGELAHVQVRSEGGAALCGCGGRGCLATLVGPSLVEFVERAYEERLALSEVLALATERDPGIRRVFADLGRIIGRPLADLCTLLDPDAIVVDSTLGDAGEFVLGGIRESIDRHTAPVVADSLQVLPGQLGDEAEVLGGVALARQFRLDALAATGR